MRVLAEPDLGIADRRLASAKVAYTVRHAQLAARAVRLVADRPPAAGDVVLARVVELGQHSRLELTSGRRAALFVGDHVLVAYGTRYAPDQFEAEVPDGLGPCQLVAAGGVAAVVRSSHQAMAPATRLEPVGLLAGADGTTVNLRHHVPLGRRRGALVGVPNRPRPWTVLVAGTAMNAGKTTVAAGIVRGLSRMGRRVGATKVTGTGAGGDPWLMRDAGAVRVLDFTDAGYVSTYRVAVEELAMVAGVLLDELAADAVDAVVVEVADGLLQPETAGLLSMPAFAGRFDAVVFAAGDALGALAGARQLTDLGLPVRAVSGRFTASPLALREACAALDVPVVASAAFNEPKVAGRLLLPTLAAVEPGAGMRRPA